MSGISPLGSYKGSSSALDRRGWNLALCFQEVFTATVRLRYRRQDVPNADSFRTQMKQALRAAEQDAIARGYNQEDIRRVTFAMVAFLDESVLSCRNPVFADWPRLPLQAELYGHQLAGEVLFQELEKILARGDSPEVADVLEVFYLCLALGFQGRYAAGGRGDLHSIMLSIREKIRRIRGAGGALSPRGGIPADAVRLSHSDPWVRKLGVASVVALFVTLASFVVFKVLLVSGISQLSSLASGLTN
jgi:type VI secretion system protein ImpK